MNVETEITDLALIVKGHRDAAHLAFLFLAADLHSRDSLDLPWLIGALRDLSGVVKNPYEQDWLARLTKDLSALVTAAPMEKASTRALLQVIQGGATSHSESGESDA